MDSFAHLATTRVKNAADESVEFGDLWRHQPIVLALIRHFG